jgi:protein-S-isoprenylcysteine O-methyltransferase Ste14
VRRQPDLTTRLGGWLFRHRTALPLPVALAILTLRIGEAPPSAALAAAGVGLTLAGEALRLWGVHHIGVISRTRSDRLGPLVAAGPFAYVRNPLYVGNVALWVGFALTARLVWLAPIVLVLLGAAYHAIVRWEEELLEARLGDAYRGYAARVPRWVPKSRDRKESKDSKESNDREEDSAPFAPAIFSWRKTLFSERGTLIAIAAGYLLLWTKARF